MRISLLLENGTLGGVLDDTAVVGLGQLDGNAAEVLAHLPENAAVRITATER